MRITDFEIVRYGRLAGLRGEGDPLPSTVVVLGRNESGKSTLFSFLCSQLYGFERGHGSRDLHPYAPWSGGDIEGRIDVVLADGTEQVVSRRLLSRPQGQVEGGDTVEELGNRPLPWVGHVPDAVYREVFALRLDELAALDKEGWRVVEERLLGGMGATDLRSVRETLAAIEEQANRLWRRDRRGKPKSQALLERQSALQRERRDARDRSDELYAKVDERARTEASLTEVRVELEHTRLQLEEAEAARPAMETARRIRELERGVGDPSLIDALPTDLPDEWSKRVRRVERAGTRVTELTAQIEALQEQSENGERPMAAEEIQAALAGVDRVEASARRVDAMERRIEAVANRRDRLIEELFAGMDGEASPESIAELIDAVPEHELEIRLEELEKNRRDAERSEPEPEAEANEPKGEAARTATLDDTSLAVRWIVGGLLAATAAALVPIPWVRSALATVAIGCVARGIILLRNRDQKRERERLRRERFATAVQAVDRVQTRISDLLGELPLRAEIRSHPRPDLAAALQRCRDAIEDTRVRSEERDAELQGVEEARTAVRSVSERLGVDEAEYGELRNHLREALTETRERETADRRIEQRWTVLTERLEESEEELRDAETERDELERAVDRAFTSLDGTAPDTPDSAVRALETRQQARRQAAILREELERSFPDALAALADEGDDPPSDSPDGPESSDARAGLRASVLALEDRVTSLYGSCERLDAEIESLRRSRTLDDVEGELRSVEEELEETKRERDRLTLVARLLATAEQRFRERHQPELIRRASEYLSRVTMGRYDRVLLDESGGVMLRGPAYPDAKPVEGPISTGTQEQLYLSLRLAALDQLDEGGERLPLFIDELFVNWDEERMRAGLALLGEIAERRQVFFFTCHPFVAEAFAEQGAAVVRLPDPPTEAE